MSPKVRTEPQRVLLRNEPVARSADLKPAPLGPPPFSSFQLYVFMAPYTGSTASLMTGKTDHSTQFHTCLHEPASALRAQLTHKRWPSLKGLFLHSSNRQSPWLRSKIGPCVTWYFVCVMSKSYASEPPSPPTHTH